MATKKAPAKTATVKRPASPVWLWTLKGDGDTYGETFKSYEAALKDAKATLSEQYTYGHADPKPPVVQFFQQVSEVQFLIEVKEVPVTKFEVTLVG